ncbi:MAG: thioredoxin domain-containing protein [Candidatus Bathyarchaeia archaeon]
MGDNLFEWIEWGPQAFERARAENKPIILDISAVWCHWCHVMDQTTYADAEVAELIKRSFIPVRVDNDRQPDVNRRYNMGGWPTTVFLTPEGKIITGGTYIPPERMKHLLQQLVEAWQKDPLSLQARAVEVSPLSGPSVKVGEKMDVPLVSSATRMVLGAVVNSFDSLYGGFGLEPKFPHTDALQLALAQHCHTGNAEYLKIVTKTLDSMGDGGIWDHEEGGFFRYSTTRDWSIPHFEKMSEDNAKLLETHLSTYEVTGKASYRHVASRIVDYVTRTLSDQKDGGFFGSQDADEEYYKLTGKLRAARQPPQVDRTVYVDWSALMSSAFLHASFTLERPELRDFALKTLNLLLAKGHTPGNGLKHYLSDGGPRQPSLLMDQVHAASSLIDACQATAEDNYLLKAKTLMDFALKRLYDHSADGFFDRVEATEDWGALKQRIKPLDQNSAAAEALVKLHELTGEEEYLRKAEATIAAFQSVYSDYGIMSAGYASAADKLLNLPLKIVIIGNKSDGETEKMLSACFTTYHPRKLIELLDAKQHAEKIAKLGYAPQELPTAYPCIGTVCLEPLSEASKLRAQIVDLRRKTSPRMNQTQSP